MKNSIIPISDEQSKAIRQAIEALQGIGGFLRETFGTVPADLVGLLGGDWLKIKRAENISIILEKTRERLNARKTKPEQASLSLALPILITAADESREEIQDIWARLLAAAADSGRARKFRLKFIEIAKSLDPVDTIVLGEIRKNKRVNDMREALEYKKNMHNESGLSRNEFQVSLENLIDLKVVAALGLGDIPRLTSLGSEFMTALEDPIEGTGSN